MDFGLDYEGKFEKEIFLFFYFGKINNTLFASFLYEIRLLGFKF
jgi:hypothetical protein